MKPSYEELEARCVELAAENAGLNTVIQAVRGVADQSSGIAGWHLNGEIATWEEILPEIDNIETPATNAFLAEVRASAIDSLVDIKTKQLADMHPDTHAFGATAMSIRSQINELQLFAAQLRKGVQS